MLHFEGAAEAEENCASVGGIPAPWKQIIREVHAYSCQAKTKHRRSVKLDEIVCMGICDFTQEPFVKSLPVVDAENVVKAHHHLFQHFPSWQSQLMESQTMLLCGSGSKRLLAHHFANYLSNELGISSVLINPRASAFDQAAVVRKISEIVTGTKSTDPLRLTKNLECEKASCVNVIVTSGDVPEVQSLICDYLLYIQQYYFDSYSPINLVILFDSLLYEAQIDLWNLPRSQFDIITDVHTLLDYRLELHHSLPTMSCGEEWLYLLGNPVIEAAELERSDRKSSSDNEPSALTDECRIEIEAPAPSQVPVLVSNLHQSSGYRKLLLWIRQSQQSRRNQVYDDFNHLFSKALAATKKGDDNLVRLPMREYETWCLNHQVSAGNFKEHVNPSVPRHSATSFRYITLGKRIEIEQFLEALNVFRRSPDAN